MANPRVGDSRNWWSLPKSKSSSEKLSSGSLKLNSLASAIGLSTKKKHPSLAIQSPPSNLVTSPVQSPYLPSPKKYTNRPPSKSISSTLSRGDSSEPRTPSDHRDSTSRRSLLTIDHDPFAARTTPLSSPLLDPNRLSAYSGSSIPDYNAKKYPETVVNRGSLYSSSSSSFPEDMSIMSGPSWITDLPHHPIRPRKQSMNSGHISLESSMWEEYDDPAAASHVVKSGSSTTLTDKNRLSQPDTGRLQRPVLRARGMTDAALPPHRSKFLQDDTPKPISPSTTSSPTSPHPTSPLSPRVIVRQPSTKRLGLPVTAPPTHTLPPPPIPNDIPVSSSRSRYRDSSSSSFSLGRESTIPNQHYIPRTKARERSLLSSGPEEPSQPSSSSTTTSSSSSAQTLKRAISQQSIKSISSTATGRPDSSGESTTTGKAPRKQRSFHHPRIPMPPMPLPLRHASSFNNVDSTTPSQPVELGECRRDSMNGTTTPVRKRLFSGSSLRRPSTSHTAEDDVRSIFSLSAETPAPAWTSQSPPAPRNPKSSFWDEPESPTLQDYTPQQIMSPAEMLKLERIVQDSQRERAMSIASMSTTTTTMTTDSESALPIRSLAPPRRSRSAQSSQPQQAIVGSPNELQRPIPLTRPSTSQGAMENQHHPHPNNPFSPSGSPPKMVSLPPPPRHRRPTLTTSPVSPVSVPSSPAVLKPLSPPPRKKSISRGIMRKPSFLHIDDEVVPAPAPVSVPASNKPSSKLLQHEDSFLDFARDSIDTMRSDNY